jgi:diguanylate cyclase (GGDEF)-like protein
VSQDLKAEGYNVVVAHDGVQALQLVRSVNPDLVLLDVMMPELDGFEVTRRLRADPTTSALPIIMLTARGQTPDRVVGLKAGADDYLVKPFENIELVERVRNILRRNREFRESSPLSGLPGNHRILREVGDRLRSGRPFAVCYCDIDGFKAVNDAYGFSRGDEFIVALARKLLAAAAGKSTAFVGHVGGDDFVVICDPDDVHAITEQAVSAFEAAADDLYDPQDRQRGYVSVKSRREGGKEVGLVTVSVGVAISTRRHYSDAHQIIADATEMKGVAKGHRGSFVAVDRRAGE